MDVFKFLNPTNQAKMEQGQIINGIKSKMWIERYRDPGEFKFVADIGMGLGNALPIGTFVSHTDTTEVMIVENHEIHDDKGSASEITVSGRSYETILDQRIIGSNKTFPVSGTLTDYSLAANYTWNQAAALVNFHTSASTLINDDDAIPFFTITTNVPSDSSAHQIARTFKYGSLYKAFIDLLAIDNVGVKVVRPGSWSPIPSSPNIFVVVHRGETNLDVIFSYTRGAVDTADYLWSNKNLKNAALVTSKWVETVVLPTEKELARRMMYVDGSDFDKDMPAAPTGATLTALIASLQNLGTEVLNSQKDISLMKPQVTKGAVVPQYRTDFNVGDLVYVAGDYRQIDIMRVVEFVEMEDQSGANGYPTFDQYPP